MSFKKKRVDVEIKLDANSKLSLRNSQTVKAKDIINLLTNGSNPFFLTKEVHLEKIKDKRFLLNLYLG